MIARRFLVLPLVVLVVSGFGGSAHAQVAEGSTSVEITSDSDRYYLSRAVGPVSDGSRRVVESYEPMCLPPCVAEIPLGLQHFAYGPLGHAPRALALAVSISPGMTLHLTVADRSTERATGIFVLLMGMGGGTALILVPTIDRLSSGGGSLSEAGIAAVVIGAVLFVGGLIGGSALAGLRDVIDLRTGTVRL